eukprot:395494-Amphidinium_carterae.1
MTAVAQQGMSLLYAPEKLQRDRQIVLRAVTQEGDVLVYVAEEMKDDHEIVLMAVAQQGLLLIHASEGLRCSRDLVLTAITQDPRALLYAGAELKGDRDFMLTAVRHHAGALQFAAEELLQDEAFAPEERQQFYFFKIVTMSGRSCTVAWPRLGYEVKALVVEACSKLGLQCARKVELLCGADTLSGYAELQETSPGHPEKGNL